MDAPSPTPERSRELADLRGRAYGPDADIRTIPGRLRAPPRARGSRTPVRIAGEVVAARGSRSLPPSSGARIDRPRRACRGTSAGSRPGRATPSTGAEPLVARRHRCGRSRAAMWPGLGSCDRATAVIRAQRRRRGPRQPDMTLQSAATIRRPGEQAWPLEPCATGCRSRAPTRVARTRRSARRSRAGRRGPARRASRACCSRSVARLFTASPARGDSTPVRGLLGVPRAGRAARRAPCRRRAGHPVHGAVRPVSTCGCARAGCRRRRASEAERRSDRACRADKWAWHRLGGGPLTPGGRFAG